MPSNSIDICASSCASSKIRTNTIIERRKTYLNDLTINTFADIHLRYVETLKFIKVQWGELHAYVVNTPNNLVDLYFIRYINTIKNISIHNEINSICYDTYYNTYNDACNEVYNGTYSGIYTGKYNHTYIDSTCIIPNINAMFSHRLCIQLFNIILSTYKLYPTWKWQQVESSLTKLWIESRSKKYSNLLPLKIRFITYAFKNESVIPIMPDYIDINTIEELRIIIISNIDWNNVNKLEFQLYNACTIINMSFSRLNKFNTIINGVFSIYLYPIYRNKTLGNNNNTNIIPSNICNNFEILDKYIEIFTVYTTHKYNTHTVFFFDMEFCINTKTTAHIANFSLNTIEMYLEFLKDVYQIDSWKIHKKYE